MGIEKFVATLPWMVPLFIFLLKKGKKKPRKKKCYPHGHGKQPVKKHCEGKGPSRISVVVVGVELVRSLV